MGAEPLAGDGSVCSQASRRDRLCSTRLVAERAVLRIDRCDRNVDPSYLRNVALMEQYPIAGGPPPNSTVDGMT